MVSTDIAAEFLRILHKLALSSGDTKNVYKLLRRELRQSAATQINSSYKTPDDSKGSAFKITDNTEDGITIQTSQGNSLSIPWEKFFKAIEAMLEIGFGKSDTIGASFDYISRKGISKAVEPNKEDTVHTQYILPILEGIGVVEIDGMKRPNKAGLVNSLRESDVRSGMIFKGRDHNEYVVLDQDTTGWGVIRLGNQREPRKIIRMTSAEIVQLAKAWLHYTDHPDFEPILSKDLIYRG